VFLRGDSDFLLCRDGICEFGGVLELRFITSPGLGLALGLGFDAPGYAPDKRGRLEGWRSNGGSSEGGAEEGAKVGCCEMTCGMSCK
jgi:hypothetical protein